MDPTIEVRYEYLRALDCGSDYGSVRQVLVTIQASVWVNGVKTTVAPVYRIPDAYCQESSSDLQRTLFVEKITQKALGLFIGEQKFEAEKRIRIATDILRRAGAWDAELFTVEHEALPDEVAP